jgi:LPPG:FO 2-phospho-L-lactate transferase
MGAVRSLGGEDWFALGDGDLALHVLRSERLARGEPLSSIISGFARRWGITSAILPMSDDSVATLLDTDEGTLDFQRYFVERRCEPRVKKIRFEGAHTARAAPGVVAAILEARAIIIAPSNPYLSIDPILAIAEVRDALAATRAPVVAVSPLINGKAVKGPTAKLMSELGVEVSNHAIARHYEGIIGGMIIDQGDQGPANTEIVREQTLMQSLEDKVRVAQAALALADRLRR